MSVGIAGLGWVTPIGAGLNEVWAQVQACVLPPSQAASLLRFAKPPELRALKNPESGRVHLFLGTPPDAVAHLARNPRLRRSSTISTLAVAAGLAALENAGGAMMPERTAVVFAICDGGVLYTRKFYEQIVKQGANVASPVLFPETVYNAPASHLAALLGIDGASYTLVGDSSVGMSALHFAAELLETSDIEQVVVVGAEECDWILCEAYRHWRLASTPLAEGAAALVLRREGRWKLDTHPGAPFTHQRDAATALASVLTHFADAKVQRIVASANGTFIDRAESRALATHFPNVPILAPKKFLGESPGAGAVMQTVLAALCGGSTLVTVVGFNHQCGAALVSGE